MLTINQLIWDEVNISHIAEHGITPAEVEDACQRKFKHIKSYRKRLFIEGKTKSGKKLAIVISPEDRSGKLYGFGIYYVITAYQKE